jgi:MFS family permease
MSVAVIPMSSEFGWTASVQGLVQAAFLWGYMATQLVGGRLADLYGGKRVVAGAIVFFSVASLLPTVLTPLLPAAASLSVVILARFLGEKILLQDITWN